MYQEISFIRDNESPPRRADVMAWLNPSQATFNGMPTPYYGFIGNELAIQKLQPIDFDAWNKPNHDTSGISIAFVARPGVGKSDLADRHNRARLLPYCKIQPRSIKRTHDLACKIIEALAAHTPPLRVDTDARHIVLPPCDVFIDEVHDLTDKVVQGMLLATEPDGARMLVTEQGWHVDCRRVHWMIATTERGQLFDAFDRRFSKVFLEMQSKENIAKIIQIRNPDWAPDVCRLVAHYASKIPGEAVMFAKEMRLRHQMYPDHSWEAVAAKVAETNGIDPFGMTLVRLNILKALGMGPVAEKRVYIYAGVKAKEVDKYHMPWLLERTNGQDPLVEVTNKGYTITVAGLAELEKRKIRHNGEKALRAA